MDKRCKLKNRDVKRNWDFKRFIYGQFYKYGWKMDLLIIYHLIIKFLDTSLEDFQTIMIHKIIN